MKFKFTWGRKLIAGILLAAVVVGGTAAPAEAASKNHTAVMAQDNYRKTLCKGFLGKSYGSVVDGIRCDCSGYTRAALNRLESKGRKGTALKNVSVGAHCTRDWVSGSSISYTTGVATKGAIQWNSGTKKSIGRKSSGKSLSPAGTWRCCCLWKGWFFLPYSHIFRRIFFDGSGKGLSGRYWCLCERND